MGENTTDRRTDTFLTRDNTMVLKGIAILLMLCHHLWAFPGRVPAELIVGRPLMVFGDFSKICVAIFSFLGGYGRFIKYSDRKVNVLTDLRNFYFKYWKVFVLFIPIAFMFFSHQEPYCQDEKVYACYSGFSVIELILNFLGCLSSYNGEWWFVSTYLICICVFPLAKYMVKRFSVIINLFIIILIDVIGMVLDTIGAYDGNEILKNLFYMKSPYFACFLVGVLFAGGRGFSRVEAKLQGLRFKPVLSAVCIVLVFAVREIVDNHAFEFIYTAVLIYALKVLLDSIRVLNRPLTFFGRHCTNMWLTHTFFCYYFGVFVSTLVFLHNPVLVYIALLLYSLAASFLVDIIWLPVGKLIQSKKA